MSKELTAFVIDLAPSMASLCDGDSALNVGLRYFYHSVISKMIKGRVTDYVSVITFHSSRTNHIFDDEEDSEKLQGVDLVTRKTAPTFGLLKWYQTHLEPVDTPVQSAADCVEALSLAVALMAEDAKGAFIKNIVLISDMVSPIPSKDNDQLVAATVRAIGGANVNVTVVNVSSSATQHDETRLANVSFWEDIAQASKTIKMVEASAVSTVLEKCPPLKRIDPRSMFKGSLRMAANPVVSGVDSDGVCMDVEVFPAVRTEKLPSMKNFLVKNEEVVDLTSAYNYYVEDETEDAEVPTKRVVEKGEWENGYRYTNKDIHVISPDAADATKLPSNPSIDVIGTIAVDDLPVAYFTEDSVYTVPAKLSAKRNILSFNALCRALVDTKRALLVRYVQKQNDEVKICGMIPCKAKISDDDYVYGMQMVRLPFKEDEKIGRFPDLVGEGKSGNPDMDQFVIGMDLDDVKAEHPDDIFWLSNDKLAMTGHQTIPEKVQASVPSTNDKLMSQNPAINKFNNNLYKLISKAAQAEDLNQFINEPDFVTKHMVSEGQTNLFNLGNVLNNRHLVNDSDWLLFKSKSVNKVAKKLASTSKPFNFRTKQKKQKGKREGYGNYGENEALEVVDIDALFE